MSMQSQNRDYHWVNHQMIENRVSGAHLNSKGPKTNLQEVSNLKVSGEERCVTRQITAAWETTPTAKTRKTLQ